MISKFVPKHIGKVVILMGGNSPSRAASLASGERILQALKSKGIMAETLDVQHGHQMVAQLLKMKPDIVFIALQGVDGEAGAIQGLLESLNIPHTGNSMSACALSMDKSLTKLIWQSIGILTPRFKIVTNLEDGIEVMQDFGLPLCVKPVRSAVGIGRTKVATPEQLPEAFQKASAYDVRVMIEPWIQGVEYKASILGAMPLPIVENKIPRVFEMGKKNLPPKFICPSYLSASAEQSVKNMAFQAFQVLGCRAFGRVDLVSDHLGNYWLLDINSTPRLDDVSLFMQAADAAGLLFEDVILEILSMALSQSHNSYPLAA